MQQLLQHFELCFVLTYFANQWSSHVFNFLHTRQHLILKALPRVWFPTLPMQSWVMHSTNALSHNDVLIQASMQWFSIFSLKEAKSRPTILLESRSYNFNTSQLARLFYSRTKSVAETIRGFIKWLLSATQKDAWESRLKNSVALLGNGRQLVSKFNWFEKYAFFIFYLSQSF